MLIFKNQKLSITDWQENSISYSVNGCRKKTPSVRVLFVLRQCIFRTSHSSADPCSSVKVASAVCCWYRSVPCTWTCWFNGSLWPPAAASSQHCPSTSILLESWQTVAIFWGTVNLPSGLILARKFTQLEGSSEMHAYDSALLMIAVL